MSNNHVITREIGNLKGFSTASLYLNPPNVAELSVNTQKAPDGTTQIRRGYQCQISAIGGLGLGTFDSSQFDDVLTVCVGLNGFLYNKLIKQIFFYYNGQVTGNITNITNPSADLTNVVDVNHGLQTGAIVIIRNVNGSTQLNNKTFTVTVVDANNFILNGVLFSTLSAYVSGGVWSISFADQRYLTFTIFTDPRYLTTNPGWSIQAWSITPWGSPSGESITCNITVNRAAQINGNQSNVNTFNVQFGHELVATDIIQFYSSNGAFNQRNILSVTPTSITFDGYPVSVMNGVYVSQFFDIPFRKGFDVISPYLISTFIATITNPTTGIYGLQVAINGDDNLAAAFLQIIESSIIDSNSVFQMDYWYWQQINSTINPPLPGSANILWQNSKNFENASMAAFEDIIFIANGFDYPQKYDGQTVYRSGMPVGLRPSAADNTSAIAKPFSSGDMYQYAITYEQIDNRGNIVEGEISEIWNHTVGTTFSAIDVTVTNLQTTIQNNWNTDGAIAVGGTSTSYGPDVNGFYYDLVDLNPAFTLRIGDSAFYGDLQAAVMAIPQVDVVTLEVDANHAVLPGDTVYFLDSTNHEIQRIVSQVSPTSITIEGSPVTVDPTIDPAHKNILVYLVSPVFGDVAIINGNQNQVNVINVNTGHTILLNDLVEFKDQAANLQRRTITAVSGTTITISGIPVNVVDEFLIYSLNQRSNAVNFQRLNSSPAVLATNGIISNNLRINIYRTKRNEIFDVNGDLYLVASIPNDSLGSGVQIYTDEIADVELGRVFANPIFIPNPPPVAKYVISFGNQMFFAGGSNANDENSDKVFFSNGNFPEAVPLSGSNDFNVPNTDDDITGIGVSGTTLVTTKNNSLWAATGNFLSGQIEVVQISKGSNIGCVSHASIASVGSLMYFLHTNGVYAITENQLYPTDADGNPLPLSFPIDKLFRETNFLPQTRYVFKRAVAVNYTKDNQYLLFLPCEDVQSTIRTANGYSIILCYDYQGKNWYEWNNMNAAGGMVVVDDDLYFQERRYSGINGNTANFYKQHRFYRLVDHADHAGAQFAAWKSSWTDLGQPEVRKKFCRCVLLMDRLSDLQQYNNPQLNFSTYLNRLPNLQSTIAEITQVDNTRNSSWSFSGWGWNFWSGYQDSFIAINLKQGTVAKSIQIGFTLQGINMDIRLAGFQIEAIPENRKSILR